MAPPPQEVAVLIIVIIVGQQQLQSMDVVVHKQLDKQVRLLRRLQQPIIIVIITITQLRLMLVRPKRK